MISLDKREGRFVVPAARAGAFGKRRAGFLAAVRFPRTAARVLARFRVGRARVRGFPRVPFLLVPADREPVLFRDAGLTRLREVFREGFRAVLRDVFRFGELRVVRFRVVFRFGERRAGRFRVVFRFGERRAGRFRAAFRFGMRRVVRFRAVFRFVRDVGRFRLFFRFVRVAGRFFDAVRFRLAGRLDRFLAVRREGRLVVRLRDRVFLRFEVRFGERVVVRLRVRVFLRFTARRAGRFDDFFLTTRRAPRRAGVFIRRAAVPFRRAGFRAVFLRARFFFAMASFHFREPLDMVYRVAAEFLGQHDDSDVPAVERVPRVLEQ
ncbi:MAG: hypothetical protein NTU62_05425 [Spirochaetes bacterium]|nr:hypothetical protein [Spirochaetota bacterium]